MGYLCDNVGLVLACHPSGSTDVTALRSSYMTQPSGIPILSPVLFMHLGDPYIPPFSLFLIYIDVSSFQRVLIREVPVNTSLVTYISYESHSLVPTIMKSTKVQTLGANIWPGVDAQRAVARARGSEKVHALTNM